MKRKVALVLREKTVIFLKLLLLRLFAFMIVLWSEIHGVVLGFFSVV